MLWRWQSSFASDVANEALCVKRHDEAAVGTGVMVRETLYMNEQTVALCRIQTVCLNI